jgi:hypothetical protein
MMDTSRRDEQYRQPVVRLLGKLEHDYRGNCYVSNQEVNEFLQAHFIEGQDVEITITQRQTTGWGE